MNIIDDTLQFAFYSFIVPNSPVIHLAHPHSQIIQQNNGFLYSILLPCMLVVLLRQVWCYITVGINHGLRGTLGMARWKRPLLSVSSCWLHGDVLLHNQRASYTKFCQHFIPNLSQTGMGFFASFQRAGEMFMMNADSKSSRFVSQSLILLYFSSFCFILNRNNMRCSKTEID